MAATCLALNVFAVRAADRPDQAANTTLSPFGIGSDYHTGQDLTKWMPQMAAIGIRMYRTVTSTWAPIEPEKGKWSWEKMDSQMAYLDSLHISYGGLLYENAPWNTLDRPGTLPVNNLSGWSNYVTHVVEHAKGKIKYWELWNEPPNGTGADQTPADYAKLMVSTYDAAKAVDRSCLVGLCAKSVHVNYLEHVIKAGAKDHFDYIVLHPYEVLGGVVDHAGAEAIYMNIVPTVRKMLAAQDPAKVNVPIIFTELGCDAAKGADVQGNTLIKAYAMGIAQGVACIEWFEGMDGDSGPMGLLEANGNPRPSYAAMAQMIKHLGQHPAFLGWVMLNDKDYGFIFQGAKGTVMAAWAPKGTSDKIDFGQSVQIVNPLTGAATQANTCALTNAPVLVDNVPRNLITQAQGNKTKPFPWDGDYSHAKSVSVVMGEKNVEKGLHTQSADSIAANVVAYGGSARSGDVPGGNVFMVDPNFLSYTATPIEVTIVVRGNAANDKAGFKLTYESTEGFKNCGWYTVPDNKEWHTVSWKINDAQFVSFWGFNFSLDSDGNQYNKYDIKSVTVKKLTD